MPYFVPLSIEEGSKWYQRGREENRLYWRGKSTLSQSVELHRRLPVDN